MEHNLQTNTNGKEKSVKILTAGRRQRIKAAVQQPISYAISDFLVAMRFWKVSVPGSLPAFFGSWLLTLISTLSIGLMVGGIAKNAKSASVIACALYFPMLIFSGATLPLEVMPELMQKVVRIFPMTQGIQLMKATFLGLQVGHIWLPIAVMGGVTVVCTGIAVKCFKWE